jgi:hypothetical protein
MEKRKFKAPPSVNIASGLANDMYYIIGGQSRNAAVSSKAPLLPNIGRGNNEVEIHKEDIYIPSRYVCVCVCLLYAL